MKFARCIAISLLAVILNACSPNPPVGQAMDGGTSMPIMDGGASMPMGRFENSGTSVESMLAYEHRLYVALPDELIPGRLAAAHAACVNATFGACNVLSETQSGTSHATLQVRIDPAGVEPIVALAQEGGTISSRESKAEDLAEAVMDNRQQQEQLTDYIARLDKLSKTPGSKVGDLITIAQEQAKTQQQLKSLSQEAAQQKRRIATNLLTIQFSQIYDRTPKSRWERIGDGFSDFFDRLAEGVNYALTILAYGVPMLLVSFPILLLLRKVWRRFTGRKEKT